MNKTLLSLLALAAIACPVAMAGPIGIPMPAVQTIKVIPTMTIVQPSVKLLSMYRSVRSFWVSRAIVR